MDAAAKKDGFGRGPEARQALQVGFHRGLKAVGVHTTAAQNPSGQTVLFQQRQQHMLGFQVLVPAALAVLLLVGLAALVFLLVPVARVALLAAAEVVAFN